MNHSAIKRRGREGFQAYEREEKFQYPISEYHIRVSDSTNSEVWRYFGDLFHNGRIVCDRVYCNPCFQTQRLEGLNYFMGSLLPKIKHYAKSVSTGNLAIHLHDKHNIEIGSSSHGRMGRQAQRKRHFKSLENGNSISEDHQSVQSNSSCFASIDSADEFDDDQEPSVIAKTIQKLAVEIIGRISTTDSLTTLIHELRSLLRLSRSNYVCLMKSKGYAEAHHIYAVSMEFVWSLIKSAIVLWRGMADQTLTTYLNAVEFAYKTAPCDFKCDEDWDLLGNVLVLITGSVKCCDQSTLVLFAETVD